MWLSTPGERAHDARRPPGGSLKSHPVVGGIALTPRYSPRPRLDNVRPAAAPPEDPVDPDDDPDPDAEAHAEPLTGTSLSPHTSRQANASVSQGLAGPT
ncbi:hypothetical protein MSG28_002816 [Choristoneura fumiferana]|uniref:Uncharacterized protein n=1 Tax=Choristoneura fumiferana TaxID=7141 RepID=A0ACC0JJD6_CHOFU|nr:hypothetical protein MSG28_002816 [Choristoneura fumiferana]